MKTRILIVLMMFVFTFTNTLQAQKLSRKKVQITGLKNANYLKTDDKGNVIAGTDALGGSTDALIKGDNVVNGSRLKIHGNRNLDVKFANSVIKGYQQVKLQSGTKVVLDAKDIQLNNTESISMDSYPTKFGTVKDLVDLTDNQFVTKNHLSQITTIGAKGDTGLQGIQGLQGIKGDTGLQGLPGPIGTVDLSNLVPYTGATNEVLLNINSPIKYKSNTSNSNGYSLKETSYQKDNIVMSSQYKSGSYKSSDFLNLGLAQGLKLIKYDTDSPDYDPTSIYQSHLAIKKMTRVNQGEIDMRVRGAYYIKLDATNGTIDVSKDIDGQVYGNTLTKLVFLKENESLPEYEGFNGAVSFTDHNKVAIRREQGTLALLQELPEYTTRTVTPLSTEKTGKMLFDESFLYLKTPTGWKKVPLSNL